MNRTKRYAVFIAGIVSVAGIAGFVWRRRKATDGLRAWQKALGRRHEAAEVQHLAAAVSRQRDALVKETPVPANPALRWHLKENILPGLALYRVLLQEHGGDQQAALAEVDEAFRAQTLAKNGWFLAPLKILPAPFQVFRLVLPQSMRKFPAEGWDITYVENDDDQVAFNITRCFYLSTLAAHGAPELTASFCKSDDAMAELFPPSIRFIRPHTLGRGDAMCDFQYCHVKQTSI